MFLLEINKTRTQLPKEIHEMKPTTVLLILVLLTVSLAPAAGAAPATHDYLIGTTGPLTAAQVDQLRSAGANITYLYQNFGGAAITISPEKVVDVQALSFVTSIEEDTVDELVSLGLEMAPAAYSTLPGTPYSLDLIDAENNTTYTGSGVWIAVLDSGFFPNWRDFFNEGSVLTEYATAFIGPNANSNINQWDIGSSPHGMAVTSMIIGYRLVDKSKEGGVGEGYLTGSAGTYWVPGVAPNVKIIPVKVCSSAGCFSSAINAGIDYITSLKKANLNQPMVINMSIGSFYFSPLRKAALDAAIQSGVIIVAAAGNGMDRGMVFPAAYEPVISVGAGGWRGQWNGYFDKTWWLDDVPENGVDEVFIAQFSARQLDGQYLDVISTGRDVVQPFPCPPWTSMGLPSMCAGKASPDSDKSVPIQYVYNYGTSFASPTIAGIVALMLEKNPWLNNADAAFGTFSDPTSWGPGSLETLLEGAAIDIPPNQVPIVQSDGSLFYLCWEMGTPGCKLEATGHGWVFVDEALAAVP
jgi:subtilisin family serine protease